MILGKVINLVETYDQYGEHRLNGLKGIYVLMVLFFINMLYTIPNPYFNYFYLPLIAMTISVTGETLKAKYLLFFYTVMGAVLTVFIFSLTAIYPIIFIFIVFFLSLGFYLITIHFFKSNIVPVPVILSLGIYSLVYGQINTDLDIALNNAFITMLAMLIIMCALLFFPKSYYFRVWLRAYILLLKQILGNLRLVQRNEEVKIQVVQGHLVQLVKYARMLSKKMPTFTILKINFLVNELRVLSCTIDQHIVHMPDEELKSLIHNLSQYVHAVEQEKQCVLKNNGNRVLADMQNSWNYLCSKI